MEKPVVLRELNINLESERTKYLRDRLNERIVGQPEAVNAVLDVMEKFHSGIVPVNRPIGSLLFLGPTGTGKTSLVENLGEILFEKENSVIKVDCGEFQHSHEIAKLIGSPPGYLGHRETPARLTNESLNSSHTEKYPISLVLFDEIEKASDALWHLLLGVLDKGTLTLGDNRVTTFDKSIIFMTSNVGSMELDFATGGGIGFKNIEFDTNDSELGKIAVNAAKRKFTPEFINRLDKIVPFNTIKEDASLAIIDIELDRLQNFIFEKVSPIIFYVSTKAKKQLAKDGFDPKYNGRNVRKTIEKCIATPLSKVIASKQVRGGDKIYISYREGVGYTFSALED